MIASVEARDYRNLSGSISISLSPGLTIFHGANGAGKTNLLDAIHFGLTGSSLRSGTAKNVIAFDSDSARVEVSFTDPNGDHHKTLVSIDRSGERRSLLDGASPGKSVPIPRVSLFHPDRLQTIKGPPAHRRSLIDQFASVLAPSKADLRSRYGRTLAQRNAQLRRVRAGEIHPDDLDVWDQRLAVDAAPLIASRRDSVEALTPRFVESATALGLEAPTISYRPRVDEDAAKFLERLRSQRASDPGRSYVMCGPHLDDLAVKASGRDLKQFGSQGQQRAAVLALQIAERACLSDAGRDSPLLLLDDVMSELDPRRRELLIETAVSGGQVVVTATEESQVPGPTGDVEFSSYRIESGRISSGPDATDLAEAA